MEAFVVAPAGFLLAVLWFDLMFDTQVRGAHPAAGAVPSISAYYRRVTTDARPMNFVVSGAMLATTVAIVVEIVTTDPVWLGWISLLLALAPMSLAARRTVPDAVRLGQAVDPPADQLRRARSILRDHSWCIVSIAVLIGLQLVHA
jgi:hypothetical protein